MYFSEFSYLQKKLVLTTFALLLSGLLPCLCHSRSTVQLANGEWPPYHSEKLKNFGLGSWIITAAFNEVEITVEYTFLPWSRALEMVRNGQLTGSGLWYHSAERAGYAIYSDPVIEFSYVLFHLKSRPFEWKTLEDLRNKTIGTVIGYTYGKEMDAAISANRLTTQAVKTDEQNLRKLLAGRIDLTPLDVNNANYLLTHLSEFKKDEIGQITYHPRPLTNDPLYLIISKKDPDKIFLMDKFNEGLARLKRNGGLAKIISAYRLIGIYE